MALKKNFVILACIVIIAGCATISSQKVEHSKNYSLNDEIQTFIHNPMLTFKNIKYIRGSRVEGVSESRDFWQSTEYPAKGSVSEELVYKGRSGNIIRISYVRKEFTWPAFYQDLMFDIGDSNIITIKNYKIKVLEATEQYIRFVILED
jgi:hypothetical protein